MLPSAPCNDLYHDLPASPFTSSGKQEGLRKVVVDTEVLFHISLFGRKGERERENEREKGKKKSKENEKDVVVGRKGERERERREREGQLRCL